MTEQKWITEARRHIGLAETPGQKTNDFISRWLRHLGAWWHDDETPWCGVFIANCIAAVDLPLPKFWMRAKAWLDWGTRIPLPLPGCIVVFERKGGGHVGFVVGETADGYLMVLGGNQGNKVCILPFARDRVLGYIWPTAVPLPADRGLPLMLASGQLSTDEA